MYQVVINNGLDNQQTIRTTDDYAQAQDDMWNLEEQGFIECAVLKHGKTIETTL